jgi:hypothetical protein
MVIDLHTNCFSGSLEIQDRVCISERAQNAKWSPAGIAGASLLSSSRIGYHVRQNMTYEGLFVAEVLAFVASSHLGLLPLHS